ncbi:bromoperoxidase [Aestuariicoccus sp. MJ-SS9]|uniref:bromoperoxidase n=1 Tax=Aestuariicoccus sp. MJ-SS9 TaxID=3079855 RepID=UPI0029087808|nr:bromoperoxidase [Aestuariicoccus sp. MJ-SS9]MDU8912425.1 bromoperoxidase [Aestuariicoccus sp. MJ-SS9]
MTAQTTAPLKAFNVVDGGLGEAARVGDHAILTRDVPRHGAAELAADMAEVYAMALLRDVPFDAMTNPHHTVTIDGGTRFTLHELLCELRSLTWFDRSAVSFRDVDDTAFSRAGLGDEGHRRSLRWNGDGQLTLRTLFRGGVACDGPAAPISPLWSQGMRPSIRAALGTVPGEAAPMSEWIDWLDRTVGADLPLPGHDAAPRCHVVTPRGLAEQVHTAHPGQIFFATALRMLGLGVGYDAGISATPVLRRHWTAQRLLTLMCCAVRRATALAQVRAGRTDRLSRPGVTAARFAVMHARDDLHSGPDGVLLRAAIDELANACPNLLHWVGRMNATTGDRTRIRETLHLPVMCEDGLPLHPSDGAAQALTAGALVTVMKAVFDLPRHQPHLATAAATGVDAAGLDRLAGDVALGRIVAGGYYHAENHADLRMGEALGLQILREALEGDNLSASIGFSGLDGQRHAISANPRAFRCGYASLRVDGDFTPWPADGRRGAAKLTAVV